MIGEQRFVYQSKPFVRPEHFGLSVASLKPIIQIQPAAQLAEISRSSKKPIIRKVGIGAAVAAVVTAIMLIFPIQDSTLRHQTAQFFSESEWFGPKAEKTAESTSIVSAPSVTAGTENTSIAQTEEVEPSSDVPRFYVVTGVYQVRKVADDMIVLLHSEGFSTASTIDRSDRIDVYTSSFSTREEAEQNLKQLKRDFPSHKDAWILKK